MLWTHSYHRKDDQWEAPTLIRYYGIKKSIYHNMISWTNNSTGEHNPQTIGISLGKPWRALILFSPWIRTVNGFRAKGPACPNGKPKWPAGPFCIKKISVTSRLLLAGWWHTYPSDWKIWVNWNDLIPNLWKNKRHVPVTTNQYTIMNHPNSKSLSLWTTTLV